MAMDEEGEMEKDEKSMTRDEQIALRAAKKREEKGPKALYQPRKQKWLDRPDFREICQV